MGVLGRHKGAFFRLPCFEDAKGPHPKFFYSFYQKLLNTLILKVEKRLFLFSIQNYA